MSLLRVLPFIFCALITTFLFGQDYREIIDDTNLIFEEKVERVDRYFEQKDKGKHSGYKQYRRWKYLHQGRLDSDGKVITDEQMYKSYEAFKKKERSLKSIPQAHNWESLGPTETVRTSSWSSHIGRVTSIAVAANDPLHIIVGTPGGGVWKSTNGGQSWNPILDNLSYMKISAVAINPHNSNHYIAATFGSSCFQSYDAGLTWSIVPGVFTLMTIHKILFDPVDPNVIIVGGTYPLGTFTGRIFRSENAGQSFTLSVQYREPVYDLEFMPGNSEIVYATVGDWMRRSTDNGVTFARSFDDDYSAAMIAVTPAAPANVYMITERNGGLDRLLVSIDTGKTFTVIQDHSVTFNPINLLGRALDENGGQAPRDMDIVVSPTDPDLIIVGGIDTYMSTDRGLNWTKTTSWRHDDPELFIHADVDVMTYAGDRLYFGTDGGVFYTDDNLTSVVDISQGLDIRQFYKLGLSPSVPGMLAAGSQDNGGSVRKEGVWYDYLGADGGECFISKFNSNRVIGTTQFGGVWMSEDAGLTENRVVQSSVNNDFFVPIAEDPLDSTTYFFSFTTDLYKTTDLGSPFVKLPKHQDASGSLSVIEIDEQDNQYIIGYWAGGLFKTLNQGQTWTEISPIDDDVRLNSVDIHPSDPDRIVVSRAEYPRALESTDGGINWDTIDYNFPFTGVNQLLYEGNQDDGIFAATNVGVLYLGNGEDIWVSELRNMPAVDVREMEIQFDTIYAATYGRGIWKAPVDNVGEVYGCTNPSAHNYNAAATYDNGTCMTCDDQYQNAGERFVDCGSVCNDKPCVWPVYFNVEFDQLGSLRFANEMSMPGDTILFADFLKDFPVKIDTPMVQVDMPVYWKARNAEEVNVINTRNDNTQTLYEFANDLILDGVILKGVEGGEVIVSQKNGGNIKVVRGGIDSGVEVKKED